MPKLWATIYGFERGASNGLLERTDRDSRGYDETLVQALEIRDTRLKSADVVVSGHPATIIVHATAAISLMQCRLTIMNSLGQPVTTFDSEVSATHGPVVRLRLH